MYWRCPDCSGRFEAAPGLKLFAGLPDEKTLIEEVRTSDIRRYRMVLGEKISSLPHVSSTSTYVAMETVKDPGG